MSTSTTDPDGAVGCYRGPMRHLCLIATLILASCGGRVAIDAATTSTSSTSSTTTGSGGAPATSTSTGMTTTGCGDVSADPANCGACGHDCLGGACSAGVCQPIVLASADAVDLAVDAENVYWVTAPGSLWKVPLGGGEATEMVHLEGTFLGSEAAIAVHGGKVYWTSSADTTVRSIPTAGGDVTPLASDAGILFTIAANDTGVYWGYGSTQSRIVRLAPGATSPTLVAQKVRQTKIAVDQAHVYYFHQFYDTLMKAPIGGGEAIKLSKNDPAHKVVVDAESIYWTSGNPTGTLVGQGRVSRVPLAGGKPVVLADGLNWPAGIATDAENVYFTDQHDGKIMRVPIAGGPVVVLAEQQYSAWALALDDKAIYWVGAGSVTKLAK